MYTLEQYRESADSIRERLDGRQPEILMILGTGLGGLGDKIKNLSTYLMVTYLILRQLRPLGISVVLSQANWEAGRYL